MRIRVAIPLLATVLMTGQAITDHPAEHARGDQRRSQAEREQYHGW